METGGLAAGKSTAAVNNAWVVFEDEAGQSMTPPRARTWGRQGITPVVRVRGSGSGRVSMAGMTCYKPGERSRLIYAIHEYRGRKDEPKGFAWKDYRDLIIRAHTARRPDRAGVGQPAHAPAATSATSPLPT